MQISDSVLTRLLLLQLSLRDLQLQLSHYVYRRLPGEIQDELLQLEEGLQHLWHAVSQPPEDATQLLEEVNESIDGLLETDTASNISTHLRAIPAQMEQASLANHPLWPVTWPAVRIISNSYSGLCRLDSYICGILASFYHSGQETEDPQKRQGKRPDELAALAPNLPWRFSAHVLDEPLAMATAYFLASSSTSLSYLPAVVTAPISAVAIYAPLAIANRMLLPELFEWAGKSVTKWNDEVKDLIAQARANPAEGARIREESHERLAQVHRDIWEIYKPAVQSICDGFAPLQPLLNGYCDGGLSKQQKQEAKAQIGKKLLDATQFLSTKSVALTLKVTNLAVHVLEHIGMGFAVALKAGYEMLPRKALRRTAFAAGLMAVTSQCSLDNGNETDTQRLESSTPDILVVDMEDMGNIPDGQMQHVADRVSPVVGNVISVTSGLITKGLAAGATGANDNSCDASLLPVNPKALKKISHLIHTQQSDTAAHSDSNVDVGLENADGQHIGTITGIGCMAKEVHKAIYGAAESADFSPDSTFGEDDAKILMDIVKSKESGVSHLLGDSTAPEGFLFGAKVRNALIDMYQAAQTQKTAHQR